MMKEKQLKVFIPFLLIFGGSFFLSDADILHNFGARFEIVKYNFKLILLFFLGDIGQGVCCAGSSLILFIAWKLNRNKNMWFSDLFWQLGGAFAFWALLCGVSLLANFYSYLWIQGMVKLFGFIAMFYLLNTLYRIRKRLYYPETRDETIRKAQKFDELLKAIMKDEDVDGK
jgi:hypothetical protein